MNEETDMDSNPFLTGIDKDMHSIFPSTDNKSVEHVNINSALGNGSNLSTVPTVICKTSNTKNLISQNLDKDEGPIEQQPVKQQQQPIEQPQQPLERPIEQQPIEQQPLEQQQIEHQPIERPIEQQPIERPIEQQQQPFKQPIDAKGRFSPFEFYTINLLRVRHRECISYLESRNECKFYTFRREFAFFRCT